MILLLIAIFLIAIHVFMPYIADLEKGNPKVKTLRRYNILTGIVIVFLFVVHHFQPDINSENSDKLILIFVTIVILLVGNAAPKLPINGAIGIRLPWTVHDEDTWRATHRVLGYCSFPIAVIMVVGGMFVNPVLFTIGGLIVCMMIPSVYSFIHYKRK